MTGMLCMGMLAGEAMAASLLEKAYKSTEGLEKEFEEIIKTVKEQNADEEKPAVIISGVLLTKDEGFNFNEADDTLYTEFVYLKEKKSEEEEEQQPALNSLRIYGEKNQNLNFILDTNLSEDDFDRVDIILVRNEKQNKDDKNETVSKINIVFNKGYEIVSKAELAFKNPVTYNLENTGGAVQCSECSRLRAQNAPKAWLVYEAEYNYGNPEDIKTVDFCKNLNISVK